MLKRIKGIKGIGLLHDVNGNPHALNKVTLIYAENGRGKSTLASIFRSCSSGDASLINNRKTLGGTNQPLVQFLFDQGVQVDFSNNAWSSSIQNMHVFDADFVEKNVYSGSEVRPDHRQGLLEFALGPQAVSARGAVDIATSKSKTASAEVTTAEKILSGYLRGLQLNKFDALQAIPDADNKIEELRRRIANATNNATLQQKSPPILGLEPVIDLNAFFEILNQSLLDIESDAESKVKNHIAEHGGVAVEDWVNRGLAFQPENGCPFCGQDVQGNDLLKAYRTYFNNSYTELKKKVSQLSRGIEVRVADQVIEQFSASIAQANAITSGWSEYLSITPINFDKSTALKYMQELRELLSVLAQAKQQSTLDIVGTEADKQKATLLWQKITQPMRDCNKSIVAIVTDIDTFKKNLATENATQLQQQIVGIELAKSRHSPDVTVLINNWKSAKQNKAFAEKDKTDTRAALDTLMGQTLQKYQANINSLLKKFSASFEIADMGFNYLGGANPRTEYGLLVRGKTIQLSGGSPSFSTTLSEGDKRTLAFAFFIATIQDDPNLNNSIVIIDDPMCSLDRHRRRHTQHVIKGIGINAKQLIVLGHDAYFLRDLNNDMIHAVGLPSIKHLKLNRVANGYSDFGELDLEQECEADYYRHHRLLTDFTQGTGTSDPRTVAKAIRPMLEGYLHRRFPRHIKRSLLFGEIVSAAKVAQPPNPLTHLQPITSELNEINSYAGQFHHDNADSIPIDDGELTTFAARALNLVHKGQL